MGNGDTLEETCVLSTSRGELLCKLSEQVKHASGNQSKDRQGSEEADGTGKPEKRKTEGSDDWSNRHHQIGRGRGVEAESTTLEGSGKSRVEGCVRKMEDIWKCWERRQKIVPPQCSKPEGNLEDMIKLIRAEREKKRKPFMEEHVCNMEGSL